MSQFLSFTLFLIKQNVRSMLTFTGSKFSLIYQPFVRKGETLPQWRSFGFLYFECLDTINRKILLIIVFVYFFSVRNFPKSNLHIYQQNPSWDLVQEWGNIPKTVGCGFVVVQAFCLFFPMYLYLVALRRKSLESIVTDIASKCQDTAEREISMMLFFMIRPGF